MPDLHPQNGVNVEAPPSGRVTQNPSTSVQRMPPGHIDAGATGLTRPDGTPIPEEFMGEEDRERLTEVLEISRALQGTRAGEFRNRLNLPSVGRLTPRRSLGE